MIKIYNEYFWANNIFLNDLDEIIFLKKKYIYIYLYFFWIK